ncbi:MAG: sigma-70 family RNA polymerase sigma factor [Candidatus Hydrogenedentes bacterium]|nr:sigma-70 family RNA polymerase sigma factor [Candidatus Hydrogenedentota bacterium]
MASTQTDAHLIQQTLQGKRENFGTLVSRYYSLVYGIALSYAGNAGDAEDIAQESFLRAYRSLDTLRDVDKFRAWLARIARNECHTWRVRNARHEAGEVAQACAEPAVSPEHEQREIFDFLWKEIRCLDETSREILILYYFHGRNTRDLAAQLDISPDAAEKRLQRARQQLGERISDKLGDALGPVLPSRDKAQRAAQAVLAVPVMWDAAHIAPLAGAGAAASGVWPLSAYVLLAAVAAMSGLTWFTFTRTEPGQGSGGSADQQQVAGESLAAENSKEAAAEIKPPGTSANKYPMGTNNASGDPPFLTIVVTEEGDPSTPIANATAKLTSMYHEPVTARTDEQGIARFTDWVLGDFGVLLQHSGYLNARSTHALGQAGTTLSLKMRPGTLVAGQVVDAQTAAPITNFVIDFSDGDPVKVHDPEGRFSFGNLQEVYHMAAFAEGYAWTPIDIGSEIDLSDLTIALQRPSTVQGRVRDTSGRPLAGVRVGATRQWETNRDRDSMRELVQTDSDGLFQFAQIDPRDELAVFEHEDYAAVLAAIPRTPSAWMDIEMQQTCSLRGTVRFAGKPAQGAQVCESRRYPDVATTDATGSYTLQGLPPGELTVVAVLPERPLEFGRAQVVGKLLSIQETQQQTLDFDFERATSSITGYVTISGPAQSQYDVRITAEHEGSAGTEQRSLYLPGGGLYWLEEVPSGPTDLLIEVDFRDGPHFSRRIAIVVPPMTELRQDFEFAPTSALQTHIKGIPQNHEAAIMYYGEQQLDAASGTSDSCWGQVDVVSDGIAVISPLSPGAYTLLLRLRPKIAELTGRAPLMGGGTRTYPAQWFHVAPQRSEYARQSMFDEGYPSAASATLDVAENVIAEVTLIASE